MAPGQRYDIVVDFSKNGGDTINLNNKSLPNPVVKPAGPLPRITQFRVNQTLQNNNLPAQPFSPTAALTTDTPRQLLGFATLAKKSGPGPCAARRAAVRPVARTRAWLMPPRDARAVRRHRLVGCCAIVRR